MFQHGSRNCVLAVQALSLALVALSNHVRIASGTESGVQDSRVDPAPESHPQPPVLTYRNPIIPHIGPADPAVIRFQGKYYLYPTGDGRGYDVFVSDDLVHWEQQPKCFVDDRGGESAPDVFHNEAGNGKFYVYSLVSTPAAGTRMG